MMEVVGWCCEPDGKIGVEVVKVGRKLTNNKGDLEFWWKDSEALVMEYTGAKDKNGTDIYKDDIIRKEECAPDDPAFGHYGSIGVVKYDPEVMGFVIDAIDTGDDGFYDYMGMNFSFNEIAVIGNIYEDHSLIE